MGNLRRRRRVSPRRRSIQSWRRWREVRKAATEEAREPCGTRTAGVRATGPRKTAGGRGCSVSGGGFQAGGPEGRRPKQTKMAAVRLPPARERKRPNGDGFAPRPMIRKGKGAPPKGGRRGENQGGGNRSPPPPRRAKTRTAQRERLQRRARSPAGDVTARPRAGAAPGRAHIPASAASGSKDLLTRCARPGKFSTP